MEIPLTVLEAHGIRAAVLEALTDSVFEAEAEALARAENLLSTLSAGGSSPPGTEPKPLALRLDSVGLEVANRSLAHVVASIEGWELSTRIGLSDDQLHELQSRIAARQRGAAS